MALCTSLPALRGTAATFNQQWTVWGTSKVHVLESSKRATQSFGGGAMLPLLLA